MSSLPVPPGAPTPAAVAALSGPLTAALTGSGPPIHPYDASAPRHLPAYDEDDLPRGLAVVVGTSGSTGTPKLAMLTAPALTAAADATSARLGGPGDCLLALPPQHIAGLQVLARALRWGTRVVPLAPDAHPATGGHGFTARAFVEATERLRQGGTGRTYTSLVPTQLARLLADPARDGDDPDRATALQALTSYDAVLVGGAATPPRLLAAARAEGIAVVTTYGSSETCGGCLYEGAPLPGVLVDLEPDGRVLLGGPVLAAGYLGDPARTAASFPVRGGRRWFRTDDLGRWDEASGRLVVEGRVDDAINTGGLKVLPGPVEEALRAVLPPGWDALVVGLPDPEWGQRVAALIAPPDGDPTRPGGVPDGVDADDLRRALRDRLPAHAIPRRIESVPRLPTRGIGKPDRAAAAQYLLGTLTGELQAGPPGGSRQT